MDRRTFARHVSKNDMLILSNSNQSYRIILLPSITSYCYEKGCFVIENKIHTISWDTIKSTPARDVNLLFDEIRLQLLFD